MKLTIKKLYELIEESINNTKQSPSDAIIKIFSSLCSEGGATLPLIIWIT